jgi:hypothetical protein
VSALAAWLHPRRAARRIRAQEDLIVAMIEAQIGHRRGQFPASAPRRLHPVN